MKKITILLIFLLFINIVIACPTENEFKFELKKGLFNYMQNPAASKITLFEVKDLLVFYLSTDVETQNCDLINGTESKISLSSILTKSNTIDKSTIPRCTDGTFYGECSNTKPKFCYSGILKSMCYGPDKINGTVDDCECPLYQSCESDGTCKALIIECYNDDNCGISQFVGIPICTSNNVYQNYINFTCLNPGTENSNCTFTTNNQIKETCTSACTSGVCY
jgi:hypothetical protein